ncbi:MAG: type I-E CRISPR-associated protein Cse2/CasB [Chloroflexi bacterium]|nr:type I-E CRISPR-associated protein Cse2/CasB [Chloroflexota bacterium]
MTTTVQTEHPVTRFLEMQTGDRAKMSKLRTDTRAALYEAASRRPDLEPYLKPWNEHITTTVAALFAKHPKSAESGNMGAHMRALDPNLARKSTKAHFDRLRRMRLDALLQQLPHEIARLKSAAIAVNWHQLMYDIHYWDHPKHFVQRQWMRGFFLSVQSGPTSESTGECRI